MMVNTSTHRQYTQVSKTMPNCTAARVPACVAMCVARHAHGELHQPEPHSRMLTHHDRSAVHMHMLYARHTTMRSRRCSGRSLSAPVSGARLPTTRRRREEQAERGAAQRQRWRHLLPHRLGTPVTGVKRPLSVEGERGEGCCLRSLGGRVPGASTAAVYEATLDTATSLLGAAV